jgi:hypothetical protein
VAAPRFLLTVRKVGYRLVLTPGESSDQSLTVP